MIRNLKFIVLKLLRDAVGICPEQGDKYPVTILVAKYRGRTRRVTARERVTFSYHCHDFFTQSLWDFFIESDLYGFEAFLNFIDFSVPKIGAKLYKKDDGVFQIVFNKNFWKRVDMFRKINEYSGNGRKILRMTAARTLAVLLHANFCKTTDMFACTCKLCPIDDLVCTIGKTVFSVNQFSQVPNLHTFRAANLTRGRATDNGYTLSFDDYFTQPVTSREIHVYELAKKRKMK